MKLRVLFIAVLFTGLVIAGLFQVAADCGVQIKGFDSFFATCKLPE